MNIKQFAGVFPLGTHLCHGIMPPMVEMKRDMEILKRHGFNMLNIQEQWGFDEPLEGEHNFERYAELIEHAAKLDLGIFFTLTCEHPPNWVWVKYPDAHLVRRDGSQVLYEPQTNAPGDGKPGPCFDHPGVMTAQLRFIRALVQALGRFENIVVWDVWQEINLMNEPVCFCPHTQRAFRGWLRKKYGSLDDLNRAWRTRHADWDHAWPDRFDAWRTCLPQNADYQCFMDHEYIGRILRERVRAIKETDPLHRPVFAHRHTPILGSNQDWTLARCLDFLGLSAYPAILPWHSPWDDWQNKGQRHERHDSLLAELWDTESLRPDYIRSANPPGNPVWMAEQQGGPYIINLHKGRVPAPEDIRRWMLGGVASGTTAISFWVTRAEVMAFEINGHGLLESEGDETLRLAEAGRVGRALDRHADLFGRPTLAPASVAILVNEETYAVCRDMPLGAEHLAFSTRGWHRLLWEAGIPVDFLDVSRMNEPRAKEYRVLILPFPIALSETTARRLDDAVRRGVHLISEACPGRMDETAWPTRGELSPVMKDLFGVKHTGFTMVREPEDGRRWSPQEWGWGEYLEAAMLEGQGALAGRRLRANVYVETYACHDSQPLFLNGDAVAGAVKLHGQGSAWLIGTFVGHNGTAYRDNDTRSCVQALLAACGVTPAYQGRLLLRKRVLPNKEAWLFTNPTRERIEETVNVAGWPRVSDLLDQPVPRSGDNVILAVDSLDIRVLIMER